MPARFDNGITGTILLADDSALDRHLFTQLLQRVYRDFGFEHIGKAVRRAPAFSYGFGHCSPDRHNGKV